VYSAVQHDIDQIIPYFEEEKIKLNSEFVTNFDGLVYVYRLGHRAPFTFQPQRFLTIPVINVYFFVIVIESSN